MTGVAAGVDGSVNGPAPTTVVFDLGGVLIDWDARYLYRKLLPSDEAVEAFFAETEIFAWNARQDAGRPISEAVASLSEEFPHHAELIAAFYDRWWETVGGPIEESVAILRSLRDDGVRLYALTNWSGETFPMARQAFDFLSWFEGIVVSGEERVIKPDPQIYQVLFDRHDIEAADAVFIDDSKPNVDAAAGLGMTALHFSSPQQLRDDLGRLGLLNG
jgi:2-haloacid dehalogenase